MIIAVAGRRVPPRLNGESTPSAGEAGIVIRNVLGPPTSRGPQLHVGGGRYRGAGWEPIHHTWAERARGMRGKRPPSIACTLTIDH